MLVLQYHTTAEQKPANVHEDVIAILEGLQDEADCEEVCYFPHKKRLFEFDPVRVNVTGPRVFTIEFPATKGVVRSYSLLRGGDLAAHLVYVTTLRHTVPHFMRSRIPTGIGRQVDTWFILKAEKDIKERLRDEADSLYGQGTYGRNFQQGDIGVLCTMAEDSRMSPAERAWHYLQAGVLELSKGPFADCTCASNMVNLSCGAALSQDNRTTLERMFDQVDRLKEEWKAPLAELGWEE